MLEFLVSWAKQLIIALIIIIMVEMIIPNSSYRKYIKVILGIFIIYTIFNPLIGNKISQINLENIILPETQETNSKYTQNQINYNKQIENVYKEKFKETLLEDIKEKGYEAKDVNVDVSYINEEITVNKLEFKITKFNQNNSITIEKVQIKQTETIDKEKIEELKQEISNTYNIEKSKIFIESEKTND